MDERWERLRGAVERGLVEEIGRERAKPRKEWISEGTLEMIEHRKCLVEVGLLSDARALDKDIKASAKLDRRNWIEEGLSERFWDPIKKVTRRRAPGVAALYEGGDWMKGPGRPCDVFTGHLENKQWGREEGPRGAGGAWGGPRLGGAGEVEMETGPFTMEELEEALSGTARKKAPGDDGIPAEVWMEVQAAKGEFLELVNQCWEEEQFPAEWRNSVAIGIHKNGSALGPANYRPISLFFTDGL